MTPPTIRLPSGVRDFLPRAATRRRSLAERVMAVFEAWGYQRIITPVFECADVLERGLGDQARAAAIRFVEPGTGEIVALRPDITPQIARVVATRMADVAGPIRLSYEGAIMRLAGDRGQHEILQAGVELIDQHADGRDARASDAEILAVAAAVLGATQLPEIRLDLGHIAPVRHVLAAAPDAEARDRIVAALGRKDRAGLRIAARALPAAVAPLAEALVSLWGPAATTLARARELAWPAEVTASLDRLADVLARAQVLAVDPATIANASIDLGDLRGFDYYTGVRFAGYVGGAPDAVLRGGRYDELLGRYGHPAHATGFALDLEAVAQAQRAANIGVPAPRPGVAVFGVEAASVARALREHQVRAIVVEREPDQAWLVAAGLERVVHAPVDDVAALVRQLQGDR